MSRLKEKGVDVPQDIAIVGYDNYKLICENTQPKLTSVSQKLEDVGQYVLEIIKSLHKDKFKIKKFKIKPELVIRSSS